MVNQVCPTCNGNGRIKKPTQRVHKHGKTTTEMTEEVCQQCGWSGWIDVDR
jgi:DnaJ-class molecular chaperone